MNERSRADGSTRFDVAFLGDASYHGTRGPYELNSF